MLIRQLDLQNFRNYVDLSISPDPGLNILIGRNAQGKTSVIEAIYVLATSRSWRAGRDFEMIRWDSENSRVFAEVVRDEQNDLEIEVFVSRTEKKQIKVNTIRQSKLADLMGQLNVVLIEPQDVEIVRGEPGNRRRFMNLEISQVQPQYCHLLVGYKRVLEQRNKLLKDIQGRRSMEGMLDVWNEQLVAYASKILERRLNFIERISVLARKIHSEVTEGNEVLDMAYSCSVELGTARTGDELAAVIAEGIEEVRAEEVRRGVTLIGPQRDDLVITLNGVPTRVYGSQGQQRSVALSLRMAELELMEETAHEPPVVLLDDVMTDLDEERRAHIFEMTRGRCQTFITAASSRVFDQEFLDTGKTYRVSEGKVDQG